jgi:transcription antitermination factor NusG
MRQWYVGYFYHGYYKQLMAAFENPKHGDRFKGVEIWYPQITYVSVKDGKKEIKKQPIFENYILFEYESDSVVWAEIRRFTPVLKFLSGKGNEPSSLSLEEVQNLKAIEANTIFESYSEMINQQIHVTGGPYSGLTGFCKAIIKGKHIARVSINLFDLVEKEAEINLEHMSLIE